MLKITKYHILQFLSKKYTYIRYFNKFLFGLKLNGAMVGSRCYFLGCRRIYFGKCVELGNQVRIQASEMVKIGSYSYIGHNNYIYGSVYIGEYFMSGPNVCIMGGNHGMARDVNNTPMIIQSTFNSGGVTIGEDVWIGCNSVVLDGVKIASHCVIGAGSVVTKNTVEWGVYAGNPAKLIKFRDY